MEGEILQTGLLLAGMTFLVGGLFIALRLSSLFLTSLLRALAIGRHDRNNTLAVALSSLGFLERFRSIAPPEDVDGAVRDLRVAFFGLGAEGRVRIDKVIAPLTDSLDCNPDCDGCHQTGPEGVRVLTNLLVNAREALARSESGTIRAQCDSRNLSIVNPAPEVRPKDSGREQLGQQSVDVDAQSAGWSLRYRPEAGNFVAEVELYASARALARTKGNGESSSGG